MSIGNTWDQSEELFNQALALPEGERAQWVRAQCGENARMRNRVLKLLEAHSGMGGFLQAPMLDFCGQRFGPYRAEELIGRGGMSVVYRGERIEGDFDKRVAIKVVLLQSPAAIGQGETQILAALEHPHIARLLDAGSTEMGFRFLLMEYVEGSPCTEYAEGLSEKQKLQIFLQVCGGVQYAHRSLVVHRDLKPDNILVTADGTVKLLDFGIAKIMQPDAAAAQTTGVRAYTANYASPEQILGQPVTTSTDIYSLGVLLCELVGGKTPRQLEGLPLTEVVEKVQSDQMGDVPLRGDLAVIARKALRRDPAERYESAGALARDIERYLDGMPIEAREQTWGYRANKFVKRNKYAVGAATLAVAGLAVATGVAVWQARLAGARFEQVRSLARSVMFELHDAVSPLPGSLDARKLIVDRSLGYLDALAQDTNASEDVQLDVARGYLRLSDIQGKDLGGASLGRSGDALTQAQKAIEISRRVVARNPRNTEARRLLVDSLDYTASALTVRDDAEKAIPVGLEAVALAERLLAEDAKSMAAKERLATVTKQLATSYFDSPHREKAIPLYRRALEMRKDLYEGDRDNPSRQQRLAEANQWLATAYWWSKDFANCEIAAREALRIDEIRAQKFPKETRANLASDANQLAMLELRRKNHEAAAGYLQRVVSLRRDIAQEDAKSAIATLRLAGSLDRLGAAYMAWEHFPEAIRYGEESLALVRRVHAADPANTVANRELIFSLMDLSLSYNGARNKPRACALSGEILRITKQPTKGLIQYVGRQIEKATEMQATCK